MNTTVTISNLNNEDEDELPQYDYDSMDDDSSSKKYILVKNFKDSVNDVQNDIIKILEEMKKNFSK